MTSTTHAFFDLRHFVSTIKSAFVAAQVARAVSFRIDNAIISEARSITRTVRDVVFQRGGADSMAETITTLSEHNAASEWFGLSGKAHDSNVENIRALNAIREDWHEFTAELTALLYDYQGNPRVYTIPDMEDSFYREQPLAVPRETQRRLRISAKRTAEALGHPELEARMLERKMSRQEDNIARMAEATARTAPVAFTMYQLALTSDTLSAEERDNVHAENGGSLSHVGFMRLPLKLQRMLIDTAIKALEQADEFASSARELSDHDFDLVLVSVIDGGKQLRSVLASPRFQAQEQQDRAAEQNVG